MTDQQIPEDLRAELREAFMLFDKDGNGCISAPELVTVMRALGQNPSDQDVQEMLLEADIDASGMIEFEEFAVMMVRKFKEVDMEEELIEAFSVLDREGNGLISIHDLRNVMTKKGDKMTLQEFQESILGLQPDEDGFFKYEDFVKFMLKS